MIPVIWHEPKNSLFASEGTHNRTRYAATCMLNDMLDTYDCQHYFNFHTGMPQVDGAVVIIHGGHEKDIVDQINQDIKSLQWVVLIGMGDEESEFPYNGLRHPNKKLWIQSPIPGKHTYADRYHLFGYMWDCKKYLKHSPRILNWFFSGQVTHARRWELAEQLRKLPNGKLVETQGFSQGLPSAEYFNLMSQSKIVLCPTGPACPDSFRFVEALEYGCIPIVDERPSWKIDYPAGFWDTIFPAEKFGVRPFPVIDDWEKFLPTGISAILDNYDDVQKGCVEWWRAYKQEYFSWLGRDLHELGAFTKERGPLLSHLRGNV